MLATRWTPELRSMVCCSTPSKPLMLAHFEVESLALPRGNVSPARICLIATSPSTLVPFRRFSVASNCEESQTEFLTDHQRWAAVKVKLRSLISNSQRTSQGLRGIRYTLGVDLGDSRTGVAVTLTGYGPRPLNVLKLKGEKLIDGLVQIAAKESVDEFVLGLPISHDGKETLQSTKVRSFAGRLATQAAQRGWRVYLVDEFGSSQDGLDHMLEMGVRKRARRQMNDSYAAMAILRNYFGDDGGQAHLVVPKGLDNQEKLCAGDRHGHDSMDEDYG